MNKKAYKDYLDRWKLVIEIEEREIQTASFELLLQKTISIWDIGRSLGFSTQANPFDSTWSRLQKAWRVHHA